MSKYHTTKYTKANHTSGRDLKYTFFIMTPIILIIEFSWLFILSFIAIYFVIRKDNNETRRKNY